jgi:hypothetical protein
LSLAELGDFAEAAAAASDAARLAGDLGHRYSAAAAALGVGLVEIRRDRPEAAVPPLTEGVALCRAGEFAVLQPYLTSALGIGRASCGDVAGALPLLEEAVEQAAARDLRLWQSRHVLWLAEGYLRAGRPDDARAQAERALGLARERHESGIEAWTLRLIAEITGSRSVASGSAPRSPGAARPRPRGAS